MDTEYLRTLVRSVVEDEGAFVVDFQYTDPGKIKLVAEHPAGITLERLTKISRKIEHTLDRDQEDFSLEVTSPGVGTPLKVQEQYRMNVGRKLKVTLQDGDTLRGILKEYKDEVLTLTWKERVKKEIGKGKVTLEVEKAVPLPDIAETVVEISF